MSEQLKPGEYVDVTIKGVRVVEQDEHGCVTVRADAHDGGPAHWPMPPQAAVSRVAKVHYAEIVASISSRSAGPGSRGCTGAGSCSGASTGSGPRCHR